MEKQRNKNQDGLASYATREEESKRDHEEKLKRASTQEYKEIFKKGYRNEFLKDKDRIIYSRFFRRLQSKTQVFIYYENDHFRRRLTHTLEVSHLAKIISRNIQLNEDLTEAIALGHDLGHTPFGHAGEKALNEIMDPNNIKRQKEYEYDEKFFDHYYQGIKVVEELESSLEPIYGFRGLNLTDKTREGILRHFKKNGSKKKRKYFENRIIKNKIKNFTDLDRPSSLEAQVVRLADYITYIIHDLEDGFAAGIISNNDFVKFGEFVESKKQSHLMEVGREIINIGKKHPEPQYPLEYFNFYKRIIMRYAINDVIETSKKNLITIVTFNDIQNKNYDNYMVNLSKEMKELFEYLNKELVIKKIRKHDRIKRMDFKGKYIIKKLFEIYSDKKYCEQVLPNNTLRHYKEYEEKGRNPNIIICNYIAGMTDAYAIEEYNRLFSPKERV